MAKGTGTAEAKKPEADDDVAFVGASGTSDAPEKKKDLTSEQPVFQENPANAAEEAEKAKKAKKAEEELNFGQNTTPPPTLAADDKKKKPDEDIIVPVQDADIPAVSRKDMETLNDAWGIASITKALEESLQNAKITRDENSGEVRFKLANNHLVEWIPNHRGIEGFVGIPHKRKIDDLDAKMIVGVLASQGKKEINLFGDRESKEKMWLEAMRQGLGVTNFQPLPSADPNSVYQKWLRESQEMQTGAAADPNAATPETPADKPAKTTADAEAPADKPAETAADAEAPADKPAETTADAAAPADKPAETAADAEAPADKPVETTADAAAPADKPAETTADAAAPADKPAEDKGTLKSTFLADKPAEEGVKAEAATADAPVAEEKAPEKPAAVKSSFIGDATTDKKDAAPAPTPPEVPRNESFEETLARRIEQTKNPKIEAALRTLKAELDNGNLKLDGMNRELVHGKLSGTKALSVKNVNAAIGYAAGLPENKGLVLPTVDDAQKPGGPQQKRKNPGLG